MVARTPPPARQKNIAAAAAALNQNLVRETVKKVDRCLARLQELQYSVSGGRKVVGGVSLSPRSTKGYLRTSLRCKQENLRMRNCTAHKSPPGKFQTRTAEEEGAVVPEWRGMSITSMLLSETVAEIQRAATLFAKPASTTADPKTPVVLKRQKQTEEDTPPELRLRRKREKHRLLRTIRFESLNNKSPSSARPRARARITFRPISPTHTKTREAADFRHMVSAYRGVSEKRRPWPIKKHTTTALLFPNAAAFHPSPPPSSSYHHHKQSTTTKSSPEDRKRIMMISPRTRRRRSPPHNNKFTVKSPLSHHQKPSSPSKTKSPDRMTISPRTRRRSPPYKFIVKSPVAAGGAKKFLQQRLTTTPMKQQQQLKSSSSFSPVKLAIRLVSPLKSRISAAYNKSRRRSSSDIGGGGRISTTIIPGVVNNNNNNTSQQQQFDSMIH